MQWAKNKQSGFTIVELLVVIVVIAILASVTVVAYRGVQQQAKATAAIATVDSWEKALRMAAVNGAALPATGACLGKQSDYPAVADFPLNVCVLVDGATGVSYSEANFSSWPSSTPRPNGVTPPVSFSMSGTTLKARGVWVFNSSPVSRTITMAWLPQVSDQCGRGVSVASSPSGSGGLDGGYCQLVVSY